MRLIAIALACALAGCSATQTSQVTNTVTTTLATAQADLTTAINFYDIVKGAAVVACGADPKLATTIMPAITAIDALVASAQAALTDATITAPAIETLATQLQAQAAGLLATSAPAIKVVAGS